MADNVVAPQPSEEPNEAPMVDDAAVAWYRRIRSIPLLSADEEKKLAEAMAQGDDEAFRRLVESNLRLVYSIARKYHARSAGRMTLSDLIQEGNLGLIRAVHKFDPTRGNRFSTYATYWIEQAIQRALETKGSLVRVPSHVRELQRKVQAARASLTGKLGRPPTVEELSRRLHVAPELIEEVEGYALTSSSTQWDLGHSDEEGEAMLHQLPDPNVDSPEEVAMREDLRMFVRRALAKLNPREREVLCLRYGLRDGVPRTLESIRKQFGVSRERVRQIERTALRKLRKLADWA